jgi:hypothetical protein
MAQFPKQKGNVMSDTNGSDTMLLDPPRIAAPPAAARTGPLDEVRGAAFGPRRKRVLRPDSWDSAGFPVRLRPAPALPQPPCQYQFPQYFHGTEAVTRVMFRDTNDPNSLQLLLLRRRLDGQ